METHHPPPAHLWRRGGGHLGEYFPHGGCDGSRAGLDYQPGCEQRVHDHGNPVDQHSVQFDSKENLNTSHPATLSIVLAAAGPPVRPAPMDTRCSTARPAGGGHRRQRDFYLLKPSMCLYGPKAAGPGHAMLFIDRPAGASPHIESGSGSCSGAVNTPIRCPTLGVVFSTPYATTPSCMIGLYRANFSVSAGHVDISTNSLSQYGFEGALQVSTHRAGWSR